MNWIRFAAVKGVKFLTCNGLKLATGNTVQAAGVRAFSFRGFTICDQVCRDFGNIPYLIRQPARSSPPESDSGTGSDSTSGGGSGSTSGGGSDSTSGNGSNTGSGSNSSSGFQSDSKPTAKDTTYGYGDDEDEREKNKRRKIPSEHERDEDVDIGGCYTAVLLVGNLMQYVEGEDSRPEHRFKNATLTRGLIKCIKRGTDNNENHDDPIVDYRAGLDGRPEYIRAVLHKRYFRSSQRKHSRRLKECIRARGIEGDTVGHILAHLLGGPFQEGNLYPQNSSLNMGYWRTEENRIKKWLQDSDNHTVDFQARLIYGDEDHPMRPTGIVYLIKFYKNDRLATTQEIWDCLGEVIAPVTIEVLPNPSSEERFKQNARGDYT